MSTPVQRQYKQLKAENPDAILFFQLGDFYEIFYEDAQVCSRVLGLNLTARHRGTMNEMPMCGMPIRAVKDYLETLVQNGYRVALANQVIGEDGVIQRKICRTVSPGATVENGTLDPNQNTYLVAISVTKTKQNKDNFSLAVADLSTGDFRSAFFEQEIDFFDELYKLSPREILLPSEVFADEKFCKCLPQCLHTPRKELTNNQSIKVLCKHFAVKNLDSFEIGKLNALVQTSALVLQFLQETQRTNISHIKKIVRYSTDDIMPIDSQTMRHLEIFHSLDPEQKEGTLLSVFSPPITAMGGRNLRYWLANPLLDKARICERSTAVAEIIEDFDLTKKLTEIFKQICDLDRVMARIVMGRANARDLAYLRSSLHVFPSLSQALKNCKSSFLTTKSTALNSFEDIYEKLQQAIIDEPPVNITEGGIFRDGYSQELDELRLLKKSADNWLGNFLEARKKESGIDKLKIKYSKTFGFCLESPKAASKNAPETWTRRQTLVNAERYSTPELAAFEDKILSAESNMFELEHQMFQELRTEVTEFTAEIQSASKNIAKIDTVLSFATTSQKNNWSLPEFTNTEKSSLHVTEGRHPVVEKISSEPFIANNLTIDQASRFHLITGPNMAGKSTFLRQNAIIILLAQIGSFVPAKACTMSIFDRIFTRVGASDNLAGGKSTFFVEMSEAARILNAATENSFVILDEIGRGTSTFDGISIAWAITEFLHDTIGAKTIFATHYHEMIECVESLKAGKNFHVSVSQNSEELIFLRKILPGGVSDSFGIEVAVSTGFPSEVIKRSREVLARLEKIEKENPQPALFTFSENKHTSQKNVPEKIIYRDKESEVEQMLNKINTDDLTPRQALEILYELKKL